MPTRLTRSVADRRREGGGGAALHASAHMIWSRVIQQWDLQS
jgi:hypothetical protein